MVGQTLGFTWRPRLKRMTMGVVLGRPLMRRPSPSTSAKLLGVVSIGRFMMTMGVAASTDGLAVLYVFTQAPSLT